MDRVKEALFNILGTEIVDADVLDLFAGTGSVGIEALSRGAAYAEFVESSSVAADVIRDNLETVHLDQAGRIVRADVFAHLRAQPQQGFDYVHVAPPQYESLWQRALEALDANPDWVNPDGVVCAQIDPSEYVVLTLTHLAEFDRRKYGSTELVFYERVVP
jgi:16S rRNA (guanine(966)-N(2))-methyltransferase RsmD